MGHFQFWFIGKMIMLDVYYQQNYTPHFEKLIIRLSRTKQPSAWIRIHKCFDENELPFFKKKKYIKKKQNLYLLWGEGMLQVLESKKSCFFKPVVSG